MFLRSTMSDKHKLPPSLLCRQHFTFQQDAYSIESRQCCSTSVTRPMPRLKPHVKRTEDGLSDDSLSVYQPVVVWWLESVTGDELIKILLLGSHCTLWVGHHCISLCRLFYEAQGLWNKLIWWKATATQYTFCTYASTTLLHLVM